MRWHTSAEDRGIGKPEADPVCHAVCQRDSMYFGALSVGADCAAGSLAMHLVKQQPELISLVFKDFSAEFLKRAEGDVEFCCCQGQEIAKVVALFRH